MWPDDQRLKQSGELPCLKSCYLNHFKALKVSIKSSLFITKYYTTFACSKWAHLFRLDYRLEILLMRIIDNWIERKHATRLVTYYSFRMFFLQSNKITFACSKCAHLIRLSCGLEIIWMRIIDTRIERKRTTRLVTYFLHQMFFYFAKLAEPLLRKVRYKGCHLISLIVCI